MQSPAIDPLTTSPVTTSPESLSDASATEISPLTLQERMTELEGRLFTLQEEFRCFLGVTNGYTPERIIETAVPNLWLDEHLSRYRFALPSVAGKSVLDMACGSGYGSYYLSRTGKAASVYGVDIDADSVRYAQSRYRNSGLSFGRADACSQWTEQKFEILTSFETIEHVPAPDKMLDAVVRMLKEDGIFYVSSPLRSKGHLADVPANPHHVREWSYDEFEALLSQYFGQVKLYGQRWKTKAGIGSVRLPTRVTQTLMRLSGKSENTRQRLMHDVRDFNSSSDFWTDKQPHVVVAVCREPHAAVDASQVRKWAYGGRV